MIHDMVYCVETELKKNRNLDMMVYTRKSRFLDPVQCIQIAEQEYRLDSCSMYPV